MTNDAKTKYLYAFEDAFRAKCEAANIKTSRWKLGMWTSAHASYGCGESVETGVSKWFGHVEKVEKSKKK